MAQSDGEQTLTICTGFWHDACMGRKSRNPVWISRFSTISTRCTRKHSWFHQRLKHQNIWSSVALSVDFFFIDFCFRNSLKSATDARDSARTARVSRQCLHENSVQWFKRNNSRPVTLRIWILWRYHVWERRTKLFWNLQPKPKRVSEIIFRWSNWQRCPEF